MTAAAAAVISAAAPARGGISGSHRPQTAARASLAHRVILYVATPSAGRPGTVTPINTATNTKLPPIKTGGQPYAIAITPDEKTAYVVSDAYQGGTVTPIRTATNTALPPIKTGGHTPWAIAITPDGKTAYVTNFDSGTVTPIRTATNTALRPIKVGFNPGAIAITP